MKRTNTLLSLTACMVGMTTSAKAQSFYVDVTNANANPQFELTTPGSYAQYPSYDRAGVGFSVGSEPILGTPSHGNYYIADGFLSGYTSEGLWQSSWLDAIWPAPDNGPHGGQGTVDILAQGGIDGYVGTTPIRMANGLPTVPLDSLDTNGQYLGIGGSPSAGESEYALWETSFTVSETTTFQYQYYWAAAGATLADGTEIVPTTGYGMGAQFFILNGTTDYSAGAPTFAASSPLQDYAGAGNQEWFLESGTFTLDPGEYYWGFSATGNNDNSYIAIEGISVSPVPEPSGAILTGLAGALLMMRRKRLS